MLRVSTINVNGLRSAWRKGMSNWVESSAPDVVCLQEVRAPQGSVSDLLGPGWWIAHAPSTSTGHAGVAVAARRPLTLVKTEIGPEQFANSGRWVEARFSLGAHGWLTIISVYVPKGDIACPDQMETKHAFLRAMRSRINRLRQTRQHVLLAGDLNAARKETDIANWRAYQRTACFDPAIRQHLDRLIEHDRWVDLAQEIAVEDRPSYTCWSYRGPRMFERDVGGRLDYQIASPWLASRARSATVERDPDATSRWSDHAPLTVAFDVDAQDRSA